MGLIKTLIIGGSAVAVANQVSKKRNGCQSGGRPDGYNGQNNYGQNYSNPQYHPQYQQQYQQQYNRGQQYAPPQGPPPSYYNYPQDKKQ